MCVFCLMMEGGGRCEGAMNYLAGVIGFFAQGGRIEI